MKKRDSDKNPFEKKNLVKLAPAAVVIAAVAAAGAQAGSSGKEVTAETREVVKSQDLESLLKTAYSYEAADDEAEEESLLKAGQEHIISFFKEKNLQNFKEKKWYKKRKLKDPSSKNGCIFRGRSGLHHYTNYRSSGRRL